MSLRHMPRQSDPADPTLHESTSNAVHHHSHSIVSQRNRHAPHSNSAIPTTPSAISNGSGHVNAIVSPPVAATVLTNGVAPAPSSMIHKLNVANEQTWLFIGRIAEQMGDLEHALAAYENALRHNPASLSGLTQVAGIARIKENYPKAVDFFQRVLQLQEDNGEVWSALGHCYLMQDDLQKAYSAYQQALYLLPNPKEDPKLWYGIGILYDRYGSLDHAEEAFSSVLRMDKDLDFDKANEILFRLGIIYKQQGKHADSLNCFDRILRNPPSPLAHADIWFQIGHVYEQQKDHVRAKDAYERVVADNPSHAKVLQQLGWLYHQDGSFQNQELAIQCLTKSLEADPSDAQSWYLLGRAYMAGQKYNKAYEAYQQAVYRDGRNPTFWCSIGVLYFQINQFRDALDAYSRAIRINPYISEVWFDLGSLYESCNNQISDAIDAYARASELDPSSTVISQRLQLLKTAQATGGQLPAAPGPQDVHPTAYASAIVPPPGLTGPPLMLQSSSQRPVFRTDSRGPPNEVSLPPPSQVGVGRTSPGPFRGGPPPPVILDESRHMPSHTPLAPMDVDRPVHSREYSGSAREGASRGPLGHQNLLLHHPVPQQQGPAEDIRGGTHGHVHHPDPFFTRPRPPSRSVSPAPHSSRARSPPPPTFHGYPQPNRQPVGPAQPSAVPSQRSPRAYPMPEPGRSHDQEAGWDRRLPASDHREWDRERRSRHSGEYHGSQPHQPYYPSRSPGPSPRLGHSPPDTSPRASHPSRAYWDSKPPGGPPSTHHPHPTHSRTSPSPTPHHDHGSRRYDPRYDARDHREYDREPVDQRHEGRSYNGSPEGVRNVVRNPLPPRVVGSNIIRASESPHPASSLPEAKERRRRNAREKEIEVPVAHSHEPPAAKKERKKRTSSKRTKEEPGRAETPKSFTVIERGPSNLAGNYKIVPGYPKGPSSPEPLSSNGSGTSNRSIQPSPTSATPRVPARVVDEDYDEGVADALMDLRYRAPEGSASTHEGPSHSPTISAGSRYSDPPPRPPVSHRGSVSSTRSRASPPTQSPSLKRPLSPVPDEMTDNKRTRVDVVKRKVSSSSGRRTPIPSTRPSPIPLRTQPASRSPEARQPPDPYPSSPPLSVVLPPHPRPIGAGLSLHNNNSGPIALPPIATLSPTSTAPSPAAPADRDRDERMQVDSSRSSSPPSTRPKLSDVMHSSKSPPAKRALSPASVVEKKEPTS